MGEKREHWGSGLGFILAAAGSAIGLGNIWKFPYIAGENGGAAFILVYLLSILMIGIPVIIAEILIGRRSQLNPVGAFKILSKGSKSWTLVGYMGVFTGFIILSYYNVVAGWSLGYVLEGIKGTFSQFNDAAMAGDYFAAHISNPVWIIGWQAVFAIITIAVVYLGVNKGIEKFSRILMPLFFFILILLVIWGINLENSHLGLAFLFKPNWASLTPNSILIALGHAFFTLSLGMGAILTYGSYLGKKQDIIKNGVIIAFLDTLIAILAGVAIFTSVFSMGFEPDAGPGLVFHVLPAVFSKMPGGTIFSILFFALLTIAALTSAISLLEVITSYFVDEKKYKRHKVVILGGGFTFLIGIPSALSFGILSDVKLFSLNFFDLVDFLSANILLPVGGMMIAVFVGWQLSKSDVTSEIMEGAGDYIRKSLDFKLGNKAYKLSLLSVWFFFIKYVSPLAILIVLLNSLGII